MHHCEIVQILLGGPGCLTFTVTPDEINPHKFSVYEELVNQVAFDNHQARVKLSKWAFT